jgi:hypothetical protein
MPVALLIEILNGILTLAPQIPEVVSLAQNALAIVKTGSVTAEQEASIRAQLDAVKAQIDGSV